MSQYLLKQEPQRFTPGEMDQVIVECYKLGASDITFQTNEPVFAEIHGQLHKLTRRVLNNSEVSEMLNYIYGPNGTTQLLSGRDVDTHYEVRPTRTERFRFRVNGSACLVDGHDGIQITLRTIPGLPPTLEQLGIDGDLASALTPDEGVVYVTGSTGSGKSTLLAAIIRDIVEKEEGHRKVLTYEAPIEFVFDSIEKPSSIVSQAEIPRHLPSFAAGVRNALRRKPRLILVGEARDPETIAAVMEAALTGHPVYTTLHSNGVAEVMRRLITSFPVDERHGRTMDVIETVRLIIWQRLVPTLDGQRTALREFLVFDDAIRDTLLDSPLEKVTATTRQLLKAKGQPLLVDAERKFKEGLIDERLFHYLKISAENADKDAGL